MILKIKSNSLIVVCKRIGSISAHSIYKRKKHKEVIV